jgi:hypothetical protein
LGIISKASEAWHRTKAAAKSKGKKGDRNAKATQKQKRDQDETQGTKAVEPETDKRK